VIASQTRVADHVPDDWTHDVAKQFHYDRYFLAGLITTLEAITGSATVNAIEAQ
tara:strand:- start:144 stop:305 length:162 start_codon:yes stop_codon:yes gene_type:complete